LSEKLHIVTNNLKNEINLILFYENIRKDKKYIMVKVDEIVLQVIKKRLGYNKEEFELFKNNPRNIEMITRYKELSKKHIILKVVE